MEENFLAGEIKYTGWDSTIASNGKSFLFLEVSKDAVPSELHIDGICYFLLSKIGVTNIQKDNILLEYKKYIIRCELYKDSYKCPLQRRDFNRHYRSSAETIFLGGTEFDLFFGYPTCINFDYPHLLEYVRCHKQAFSARPIVCDYRHYNKTLSLDNLRKAAADGLVEKPYHPKLPDLYIHYIDESEAASIYVAYKNKLEAAENRNKKIKLRKLRNGQASYYVFRSITYDIDNEISEHLRSLYPIWAKHALRYVAKKTNLYYHLRLAKNLGIKLKPSIFKAAYPYVKGILSTKNEYYKFIKLAIDMKLIKI